MSDDGKPITAAVSDVRYESRKPRFSLDDGIILAPETRRMFDEAIAALRHHKTIYDDWGFGEVDPMGKNMILNLYGPPGTGKTLAAEALAGTLQRNYFHVGISELESKYVGETAKNISHVFSEASKEAALLFFDEADTLLGARLSSVTQGIDNEINAMRSTLLIELERFQGVVVFATNFAKNYDSAFVGRIRYHVEFKLPGYEERLSMLLRLIVPKIPLEEDRESLAKRTAQNTEGFSGRDLKTVIRIALPRALANGANDARLGWINIQGAIADVRSAKENVGRKVGAGSRDKVLNAARDALGFSSQ